MFTRKPLVCAIALSLVSHAGLTFANDVEEPEVIQVRGIKGSLDKALSIKRSETQIVDAIVAEDIGKFPDSNVVEALQRVTGVQTTGRGGGEVSAVSIRGLTDVNTTINGRAIFTGAGRAVALADIPASLLAQVDVFKTRSAAEIENGIAGSLDIKTQRPFNFEDSKIIVAGRGIYADQAEELDPNVSLLVSDRWDLGEGEFGALINLSFARTHYRDMSMASGAFYPFNGGEASSVLGSYDRIFEGWTPGSEAGLSTTPGSTITVGGVDHEYMLARDAMIGTDFTGVRERPAANISLQWAPNDELEFVAEAFYNGYRNESSNYMNFDYVDAWWDPRVADQSNVVFYQGTNVVKSRSVYNSAAFSSGDATQDKTDSYLFALGGTWHASDELTLKSELVYQTSEYETEFYGMQFSRTNDHLDVDFNAADGLPSLTYFDNPDTEANESDLTDPKLWRIGGLYHNQGGNSGDALSWTFDGSWYLDGDLIEKIRFGGRLDLRGAEATALPAGSGAFFDSSLEDFLTLLPNNGNDFVHQNTGFFDGRADIPQTWLSANSQYLFDNEKVFNDLYGEHTVFTAQTYKTFAIDETAIALYAVGNFYLTDAITGEFGLRYVSYAQDMEFWDDAQNYSSADASTTKLLPSMVLNWEVSDDLIARVAYSQTLRMPAFADLNSHIYLAEDQNGDGWGTGHGGNPDLQPTESVNYDLSLEWYFADASSLYGALFRRDIEGFVIGSTSIHYDEYDQKYLVTSPQNASNGMLQGAELGLVWFPEELPEVLDGLGVQASVTLLDSEQDYPIMDGADRIGWDTYEVIGVSDLSYSVVLAYDKEKFGARLGYVWRDDFYAGDAARIFANPYATYSGAERDLSFQLSYDYSDNLSITLDATNLLDDVYQTYYGEGRSTLMNANNVIFSRTFAVGVRYSM